jgi:hypothetical protein
MQHEIILGVVLIREAYTRKKRHGRSRALSMLPGVLRLRETIRIRESSHFAQDDKP